MQIPCHTIYHFVIAFVDSGISTTAPPLPLSSLLASSVAWRGQLLYPSSLCHLVMTRSAASTTCRYHFAPFLAAVGDSTVSTPNAKGTLSVDPAVARNTLRSSNRHWAKFFSGRPGPVFSPPALVPNITRRVSRSLRVRCTAPANRRRRLRMVVLFQLLCVFIFSFYLFPC